VLSPDHLRSNRDLLFNFLNLGAQILTCTWSLCQTFIVVIVIGRRIHAEILRNVDFNLGISEPQAKDMTSSLPVGGDEVKVITYYVYSVDKAWAPNTYQGSRNVVELEERLVGDGIDQAADVTWTAWELPWS